MGETMAAVPDRDTLTEILKRRRRFQRAFRRHLWKSKPKRQRQMGLLRYIYARRNFYVRTKNGWITDEHIKRLLIRR